MKATRKQIAEETWQRLRRGPHLAPHIGPAEDFTPEVAESRYRNWAESWVLAEVARLVPELRHKLDVCGNIKPEGAQ